MAGFIFIAVVVASMLFIVMAWIIALRENRLALAAIERTEHRAYGPTPLNFQKVQVDKRPMVRRH